MKVKSLKIMLVLFLILVTAPLFSEELTQCEVDCMKDCQNVPGPISSAENFLLNCLNYCVAENCNFMKKSSDDIEVNETDFANLIKEVAIEPSLLSEVDPRAFRFVSIPVNPDKIIKLGSNSKEAEKHGDEYIHDVKFTKSYAMQMTEMPQVIYEAVMDENPSAFKGTNRPVEMVTYYDAYSFISRINKCGDEIVDDEDSLKKVKGCLENQKRAGKKVYDLATEAQWENAARGGVNQKEYPSGSSSEKLSKYACYNRDWEQGTCSIGSGTANKYGLYDMSGNVWEWVSDWYDDDYYKTKEIFVDPKGPETGSDRALRGGGWNCDARNCRSANRGRGWPDGRSSSVGFRLVRT
ncbi:MAG: formylglycine-generating enzyme family protein [Oligoflexia bacterium]|nr:formylglycine-generating enzyme family protein [Oligoflexia bacterium]